MEEHKLAPNLSPLQFSWWDLITRDVIVKYSHITGKVTGTLVTCITHIRSD